jgi:RNA polymerase sigma-70 factor (ECF subfamily)
MSDSPTTRASLLVRLRDAGDARAWSEFSDVYVPLIYGFARRHGLQDADAADLTQDVLRAVSRGISKLDYDPRAGTFRGWLFTVVRNKLRDFRARPRQLAQGSGDTQLHNLLAEQPGDEDLDENHWETQWQQQVFQRAARQIESEVEPATWQAFWRTAVEGRSGKEVATELGLSVAAVYLAKSRVMARLKQRVQEWGDREE